MPMVTSFDTLHFVKKLKNAGFSEEQAEAISEAFKEAQTDADIATNKDIELLGSRIETRLAETRSELIRWVVGAGFLQTTLIAALLLKLVK
jgi:hypothetical protein